MGSMAAPLCSYCPARCRLLLPHLPGAVPARVGRHPGGSSTSRCRTVGPQTQESPTARHLLVDATRSALSGCRPDRPVMAPSSLQDRHDSACG